MPLASTSQALRIPATPRLQCLASAAIGYGFTSLLVFAGYAVLLYLLARRFTLPPAAALLATGVWAFC
jgi:hypothetical protein